MIEYENILWTREKLKLANIVQWFNEIEFHF